MDWQIATTDITLRNKLYMALSGPLENDYGYRCRSFTSFAYLKDPPNTFSPLSSHFLLQILECSISVDQRADLTIGGSSDLDYHVGHDGDPIFSNSSSFWHP